MNSHSLIYKMQKIKSTQQNDQGAPEKMGAFVYNVFDHCGIDCKSYSLGPTGFKWHKAREDKSTRLLNLDADFGLWISECWNLICYVRGQVTTYLLCLLHMLLLSITARKDTGLHFGLIYYVCPSVYLSLKDVFNESEGNSLDPSTQNYTLYSII